MRSLRGCRETQRMLLIAATLDHKRMMQSVLVDKKTGRFRGRLKTFVDSAGLPAAIHPAAAPRLMAPNRWSPKAATPVTSAASASSNCAATATATARAATPATLGMGSRDTRGHRDAGHRNSADAINKQKGSGRQGASQEPAKNTTRIIHGHVVASFFTFRISVQAYKHQSETACWINDHGSLWQIDGAGQSRPQIAVWLCNPLVQIFERIWQLDHVATGVPSTHCKSFAPKV